MTREVDGKVIRPPMERITSGKTFHPSRKLIYKGIAGFLFGTFVIWLMVLLTWAGTVYLIALDEGQSMQQFWTTIVANWVPLSIIILEALSIFVVPAMILYPFYVRSMEYSVIGEEGEAMPEIYVRKGIFNVTRKHVPFRTITNIASKAGPFDRVFGIGNVEIETAGYSGSSQQGPEEKLEGLTFYEELRDFVLRELRKYRDPYATATEVVRRHEEPVPRLEDSLQDDILLTLREIRDNMEPLNDILKILREKEETA
jgi:membrane protein YdbS with pleckstrin-like domain